MSSSVAKITSLEAEIDRKLGTVSEHEKVLICRFRYHCSYLFTPAMESY